MRGGGWRTLIAHALIMRGIQEVPSTVVVNVDRHLTAGRKREQRRGKEWGHAVLPSSLEKGKEAAGQHPGLLGEVREAWRSAPLTGPATDGRISLGKRRKWMGLPWWSSG